MQTATLNQPRAATLADLRVGDVVFHVADLFAPHPPVVCLGTVTRKLPTGGFYVQRERTSEVGDSAGPQGFFANGKAMHGRGVSIAIAPPVRFRGVGSLAVAS